MTPDLLLGIDSGTSLVKAALFDLAGHEIAAESAAIEQSSPRADWAETGMDAAWHRAAATVRRLLSEIDPGRIACVGVTGCMVGAWLIDAHGQPVRDAILWNDGRTQPLIDRLSEAHPGLMSRIFASSGSVMQQGCTLPVLRWLADHEPDTLARTRWVLGCKDWLRYRLTGVVAGDETEASVAPGDAVGRCRSNDMLRLLGADAWADRLPAAQACASVGGLVTAEAAAATGLLAGTPVAVGAGDVPSSAVGAGVVVAGRACTVLGTTCLNGVAVAAPVFEPRDAGLLFCLPGGMWLRTMVNVAGTTNLDWALARLLVGGFAEAERLAAGVAPGAEGVIYLPYLASVGVISPFVEPAARADFFGLTDRHETAHLLRAVYEGIACSIRDCYAALPVAVSEIRLTGGGSQSRFLAQMIADVSGLRVVVPEGAQFGAKGAALLAGVAVGLFTDVAATQACVRAARVHEPNQAAHRRYGAVFAGYRELRRALLPVWQSAARRSRS